MAICLLSIFLIFIVELVAFRWGTAKLAQLGVSHGEFYLLLGEGLLKLIYHLKTHMDTILDPTLLMAQKEATNHRTLISQRITNQAFLTWKVRENMVILSPTTRLRNSSV